MGDLEDEGGLLLATTGDEWPGSRSFSILLVRYLASHGAYGQELPVQLVASLPCSPDNDHILVSAGIKLATPLQAFP